MIIYKHTLSRLSLLNRSALDLTNGNFYGLYDSGSEHRHTQNQKEDQLDLSSLINLFKMWLGGIHFHQISNSYVFVKNKYFKYFFFY